MSTLARLIATGLFTGYAPVASGTFGTFPGIAVAFALLPLAAMGTAAYSAGVLAVVAVCIWAADVHARELGIKDPSVVVSDEIAGYVLAVAFLPLTVEVVVAGFLLFRFFDILKPPPLKQAESLPGGWGICADDLLAGVISNLLIRAADASLFPGLLP